jgi:hypothetical protein
MERSNSYYRKKSKKRFKVMLYVYDFFIYSLIAFIFIWVFGYLK